MSGVAYGVPLPDMKRSTRAAGALRGSVHKSNEPAFMRYWSARGHGILGFFVTGALKARDGVKWFVLPWITSQHTSVRSLVSLTTLSALTIIDRMDS